MGWLEKGAGRTGHSAAGGDLADEQADPHVPGGVRPARGDPAAGPQLPTLLRQDLRGAAPEEGAPAGGLHDGLQQTIQNPGAGSAAHAGVPCLCLAPTYELALQIGQVVRAIGKFCTDIKVNYAVRGNRIPKGTVLEEQIIIGTPGTTLDWCFKHRILDLTKISLFVLDEADIMIDTQGLSCQSIRIHRALPKNCQVLLFSATFKEPVRAFAERIIPDPIVIKLREEELTLSNIRQYFMVCQNSEEQYKALCNLYGSFTIGQVMIFCQTRRLADWLSEKMSRDGHQVATLTAELTVVQRASVIQRFREGKEKVLIATNVCARGIDVQQVTTVVNFGLPRDLDGEPDFETYLHRIGRAGRFGHRGIAFSMVENETVELVHKIEEHFQTTIKQLDPYDMDELERLAAE
ncbi:ATP-dependent RNA helicase DDX25 isoform X2 [Manacus candei]|uniref:ATP-dependent RNA helicase DDX25 isoform X2 n=1 Tax=Manacus candei TaxID=415023 RepID=UPI0022271BD7|nr:ATP-dependent RNA helicase DDX25 isoform X2 [Manacus candei]